MRSVLLGGLLAGAGIIFSSAVCSGRFKVIPSYSHLLSPNQVPSTHFVDIAEKAGLEFRHSSGGPEKKYILESISGGVAWIDYNRDGWPDLYFVNGGKWEELATGKRSVSNALFRNNHDGTFTNVTRQAGVEGNQWGLGVAVGDYNNDGWPDFYVCNYGPNTLYRNNGDGTFTDVAAMAGVADAGMSSSAAFADYDNDGWVDLYVTNYVLRDDQKVLCPYRGLEVLCGPKGLEPAADVFYHNNKDGTFSDVTQRTGTAVSAAYGLGVVWGDYDNDGDVDLFVANDSMPNFLFQNQGNGTFKEVGLPSGIAFNEDGRSQASMGIDLGDFDRDGFLDLYVTNFSEDYNTLYRNLGNGRFRDVTYDAHIAFPSWTLLGWGTGFVDLDNDSWEDVFVSNGHIYPQVDKGQIGTRFKQPKLLFHNLGNGKFGEIASLVGAGLAQPQSSRGAAFADFDNDGDMDAAVNSMDGPPSLFRNDGGNRNGHWLILTLEGDPTNRSAIGARVVVELEKGRQMREIRGGSGYQSTNDLRVHFGLGSAQTVKRLMVRWTDGKVQEFQKIVADRHYRLKESKRDLTTDFR